MGNNIRDNRKSIIEEIRPTNGPYRDIFFFELKVKNFILLILVTPIVIIGRGIK
jgi:hypothetical protein